MTTTFYIFHGDDSLGIDDALAKLRAEMGQDANADLNTSEMDGTSASVPEIINAVSSFPFLSERRLVIVRGLLGWLTRKGAGQAGKEALAQLAEALPALPAHARLVLVERQAINASNAIIKLAENDPSGYLRTFGAPKDPTAWITRRAKAEYSAAIEPAAAAALANLTGDDLRRADNELVKLVNYVDGARAITEDDVAALTPYVPEANIFRMVEAIAEGRGALALELLHRLLAEKGEDPFRIYGMIVRQFRLLLVAKEHLAGGGAPNGVASAAGVAPFVAQILVRQVAAFTLEDLEHIYRSLGDIDLKMKTGQVEPGLALDLFVAGLSR